MIGEPGAEAGAEAGVEAGVEAEGELEAGRASGEELAAPPGASPTQPWDGGLELVVDRRNERRLLIRELALIVLLVGLVALRVIFVDGA